jgi:hypothetical protein
LIYYFPAIYLIHVQNNLLNHRPMNLNQYLKGHQIFFILIFLMFIVMKVDCRHVFFILKFISYIFMID